jgi:hypothetical protein
MAPHKGTQKLWTFLCCAFFAKNVTNKNTSLILPTSLKKYILECFFNKMMHRRAAGFSIESASFLPTYSTEPLDKVSAHSLSSARALEATFCLKTSFSELLLNLKS